MNSCFTCFVYRCGLSPLIRCCCPENIRVELRKLVCETLRLCCYHGNTKQEEDVGTSQLWPIQSYCVFCGKRQSILGILTISPVLRIFLKAQKHPIDSITNPPLSTGAVNVERVFPEMSARWSHLILPILFFFFLVLVKWCITVPLIFLCSFSCFAFTRTCLSGTNGVVFMSEPRSTPSLSVYILPCLLFLGSWGCVTSIRVLWMSVLKKKKKKNQCNVIVIHFCFQSKLLWSLITEILMDNRLQRWSLSQSGIMSFYYY